MIYRFIIISDEVDGFMREIQIDADAKFLELHKLILASCGYEDNQLTSFTICENGWEKGQEITLEEMDTDGVKKGATYNVIRDWIKEKYGYRGTNLNIAQVKQKHGIIERENYNKPKSPDSKQPGCPEEKVKVIEDALRHFQMVWEKNDWLKPNGFGQSIFLSWRANKY